MRWPPPSGTCSTSRSRASATTSNTAATVLVFDIDAGHRFVKRIPTGTARRGGARQRQGGLRRAPTTGRLYVSTIKTLDLPRPARPRRSSGRRRTRGAATGWRSRPTARRSTSRRSRGTTGTSSTRHDGDVDRQDRAQLGRAQHGLRARRPAGLPGRAAVAAADGRRHRDAHGRQDGRPVRAPRSGRSRSTAGRRSASSTSTSCSGSRSATSTTGKVLHRVEVDGVQDRAR